MGDGGGELGKDNRDVDVPDVMNGNRNSFQLFLF